MARLPLPALPMDLHCRSAGHLQRLDHRHRMAWSLLLMFAWTATATTIIGMLALCVWLVRDAIKGHLELKAERQKWIKHDIAKARRPGYIHPGHRKAPTLHDEDWH